MKREHRINHVPRGIDVCAALNEQTHYPVVPSRTRDMQGQDPVDDRVDRLAVIEGVGDQAEVAGGGGGVEAKVGDCIAGRGRGQAQTNGERKKGGDGQSRVTLYLASARWLRETPGIGGETEEMRRRGGEFGCCNWKARRGAVYMGPGGRYR